MNAVCPGLVATDLGRSIAKISRIMEYVVPLYNAILGKSAEYGARFYVTAASTSENEHVSCALCRIIVFSCQTSRTTWPPTNQSSRSKGKYIQSLFTEEEYCRYVQGMVSSILVSVQGLTAWSSLSFPNLESVIAIEVKATVWNEIIAELKSKVPALKDWQNCL